VDTIPPEAGGNFLPANQMSRAFDQENEQIQRDSLELDGAGSATELKGRDIQLELFKRPSGVVQVVPRGSFYTQLAG
jgi:hypothetical protein